MKIALLSIATNKYIRFVRPLYESAVVNFVPNHSLDFILFTDSTEEVTISGRNSKVIKRHWAHEPWPYPTLKRYHAFLSASDLISEYDYVYYSDVDMRFADVVGDEILGELVGTIHPGFYNKSRQMYSYEKRQDSKAHIPLNEGIRYYAGGFNGGSSSRFLEMSREISSCIDDDLSRGFIAEWHDESHMNRYFKDNPPTVELSPSYCYPESWPLPFEKKLLALDKNHAEMRKE
jgi:histo-blood group ABO system transferase